MEFGDPMKPIHVFGIPNCSSVKKARTWFDERGVAHNFHDFKKAGLNERDLDVWIKAVGWEILLNRKGTTWRGLPSALQQSVTDAASARAVLLQHPSLIKRPVVVAGAQVLVGVNPEAWSDVI
jgi:Spx/MgsR family transcriptional regulator